MFAFIRIPLWKYLTGQEERGLPILPKTRWIAGADKRRSTLREG